jgi:hypothetical protein
MISIRRDWISLMVSGADGLVAHKGTGDSTKNDSMVYCALRSACLGVVEAGGGSGNEGTMSIKAGTDTVMPANSRWRSGRMKTTIGASNKLGSRRLATDKHKPVTSAATGVVHDHHSILMKIADRHVLTNSRRRSRHDASIRRASLWNKNNNRTGLGSLFRQLSSGYCSMPLLPSELSIPPKDHALGIQGIVS